MVAFDVPLVSTAAVQDAPSRVFDDPAQLPVNERVLLSATPLSHGLGNLDDSVPNGGNLSRVGG